ncbi:MAG TPA: helix-hairpin-helix domain-containing protein [Nocardioidaceae bacterium]|jgi:competence protein ComEA|nr:helix-hairpin-helix domain-containing protein [Nocardioidaceae bacterium]
MRSRTPASEQVAEMTRRRLELLSAELAGLRDASQPSSAPRPARGGPEPGGHTAGAAPGRHARRATLPADRVGGWFHDRLPPALQGRVQLGASHLTVVALLVAAALGASAWFVLRARPAGSVVPLSSSVHHPARVGGQPAALVTPAAAPEAAPAAAPTPSPSRLVVDVAGKVRHPGIVTLPAGARVVDALQAAGGVRRHVDLSALNLARRLVDGEQVLVGLPPPAGVAAPAASAPGAAATTRMINLNTATEPDLESLPGVGPVTAAAILKWRSAHGPFTAVDQLLDVSGIGDATLAEIAPFVTL